MLRLTVLRVTLLRNLLITLGNRLVSGLVHLRLRNLLVYRLVTGLYRLVGRNRCICLNGLIYHARRNRTERNLIGRMSQPVSDHEYPKRAEQDDKEFDERSYS